MGEAKRKKAAREAVLQNLRSVDIERVAGAIRRLSVAASPSLGVDCYAYAAYGQWLLARLGVPSTIAVGYAAWRVGDADHDVIGHDPSMVSIVNPSSSALAYHAWLEVAGRILDFTTHQLPHKAAVMDAIDGRHTTVAWCPDYLFVERAQISSMARVRQDYAGLFYYQRIPALEAKAKAEAIPAPEADLQMLWLVYQNPEIAVTGPNDLPRNGTPTRSP
jgi:hypothetical protein